MTFGLIIDISSNVKFNNHQARHPLHSNTPQSTPSPIRFHVHRFRKADIVKGYQKNWAAMKALFTSFQGSERFEIDMLNALIDLHSLSPKLCLVNSGGRIRFLPLERISIMPETP